MKKKTNLILLLLIFILISGQLSAQTKEELQKRKQQTEKDIKITNQLLKKTEKSKSAGLNKILIIKKRISLREQLINQISSEINILENEVEEKNNNITKLENDLQKLKEEYAKLIYFAYKNRNNQKKIMFILSAEDFNQAYRRMKYFQQYSNYRKKQAEKIFITKKNLEYEIEQLNEQKNKKTKLLGRKEREKQYLNDEKRKSNQEIKRLSKKEKELRKKIKENERIRIKLEKEIAELIAKEAAKNKTYKTLSASEETISNNFRRKKGKLNWPVSNGIIIREFGEHPHPVIKGVKIKNEGIDISSDNDAKVKSIFEGEIKKVFAVPGANMAVIIRHGHYLTLYSNIVNVRVKPGDIVKEGQHIGDIYENDKKDNNNVLHLRVYEEMKVHNPINWLRKI